MTDVSKSQSFPHSGILVSENSSAIEMDAVSTAPLISQEGLAHVTAEVIVEEESSLTNGNADEGTTETST